MGFSSAILSALNGVGSSTSSSGVSSSGVSSSGVSSSVSGVVSRVTTTNDHSHSHGHDDGSGTSGTSGTTISSDSDNGDKSGNKNGNRLLLGTTTPTASSVGFIKGLGPRAVQVTKIKGGSLTPTYKPTQKPTLNPTGMFRYNGL